MKRPLYTFPLLRPRICLLTGFLLAVLMAPAVHAQTEPVARLENEDGEAVFEAFPNGGFVAYGRSGAAPVEGAGTRMMWDPGRGAFRAGYAGPDEWNQNNTGTNSVAMGFRTRARGTSATALGFVSAADGNFSFAAGSRAVAAHNGTFVWADATSATRDFASTDEQQFLIRAVGGVGIGTNAPSSQLHVVEETSGSTAAAHVALIENTSVDNNADALALRLNTQAYPNASNNYISFYNSSDLVGEIQGNGTGGIELISASADFAERLPRLNPAERMTAGDVVGVFGGKVTKATDGAEQVMVVTDRALVVGNDPGEAARAGYETVSFVGQVPVRVRGAVAPGDLLVASGAGDGTARAVAPEAYDPAADGPVVGRAWAASPGGTRRVNAVVGVDQPAALRAVVIRQQEKLVRQARRMDALEDRLAQLEARPHAQPAGIHGLLGLVLASLLALGGLLWRRRTARAAVVLLLLGTGLALPAHPVLAQTPAAAFESADGDDLLHVFEDGGLAAFGTEGSGAIPVEGAGTRLMWYPEKATFRAGRVGLNTTGDEWNDANVGDYSMAFGVNTIASGDFAIATGESTTASGSYATAMGFGTTAATDHSLSIGYYNRANQTDDGTLFVVGNGVGGGPSRSDALVLEADGDLSIVGDYLQHSDRRLKTDIAPLGENVLEALAEIQAVRYRFRDGTGHPTDEQIGLIAQDVQAHFPELVREGTDGHLALSYTKLTAVFVKGLQEQHAEIARLRAEAERVGALEARLTALEAARADRPAGWTWPAGLLLAGLVLTLGLAWRRS